MTAQGTILGIAIAFSSVPWYPTYAFTSLAWGLSPTVDQQIAGLIMWIPASSIYVAAALVLLGIAIAGPSGVAQSESVSASRSQTLDVVKG
jgi:putative membrane protein